MNATQIAKVATIALFLGVVITLFIANPLNTLALIGALVALSATLRVIGHLFSFLTKQEPSTANEM